MVVAALDIGGTLVKLVYYDVCKKHDKAALDIDSTLNLHIIQ